MSKKNNYVSPSSWYGDPSKVMDNDYVWKQLEFYRNREEYGCSRCAHTQKYWNHHMCSIGRKPGKRGFCLSWQDAGEGSE